MHFYRQPDVPCFFAIGSLLVALALVLYLGACSVQEKAEHLDPFAAVNPFQRHDPFAPNNPLAAKVAAQWKQELGQPNFLHPGDQWHTKAGRNGLIYRLIFIADYRFSKI